MPQVPVEPLLSQHRDEGSEQRDHQTRVHEPGDGDDLARGFFQGGWNGRDFVRYGGLVEGEEDRTEEGCGLFIGILLETRLDIDDEGGADGGE